MDSKEKRKEEAIMKAAVDLRKLMQRLSEIISSLLDTLKTI